MSKQDTQIKIAILEDNDVMRDFLSDLVHEHDDLCLEFAAENLANGIELLSKHDPDLCLVDMDLPDGSGIEFINSIKSLEKGRSLVLTVLGDKNSVMTALKAGANGYLLKDTPPEQIIRDIKAVVQGKNPISPQAATHLLNILNTNTNTEDEDNTGKDLAQKLSPREKDILICFSKGLSYKETAQSLSISKHTVNDYVKSIYQKLEVHSRNEAIYEAKLQGYL